MKLGNYRLERLLGQGRMGAVYLAKDEALLRPTAVKILSWSVAEAGGQDPVQWFLAEARLVARVSHPNVVQIYGAARHGDHCYLAMEYVAGRSADVVVARGQPMAPELATDVLVQAASALQAAHRSGVIHRDVKPGNLLLGDDGVVKLGDFGMALGPAEVGTGSAHLRVGTPYYTAPELWRGGAATAASDIYSLGATYFQLLTGRPPYAGDEVSAVEQAHLRALVPDPRELAPHLPPSCAALVRRALAKTPRERHSSAQELVWEGRRVLQEIAAAARLAPEPVGGPWGAAQHPPQRPRASTPPATGPLADVLGFLHQPFCEIQSADWLFETEPLATARRRLLECCQDETTAVLAVTGEEGSGRAALCRRVAAELGPDRLVLRLEPGADGEGRSLPRLLCRAAGVAEQASEEGCLRALVGRLGEERWQHGPALAVVDGATASTPGLNGLVGAALSARCFQLVLCGVPGLPDLLARDGFDFRGQRVPEVALRPLDRTQIRGYVCGWLEATLAPHGRPVLFSPDALLLLALRSGGMLERVNCIAENMLLLAAAERRRTLSSWHAWTAADGVRWSATKGLPSLSRRPAGWPPPEVMDVLDACRREAGMPPWPRAAARDGPR